MLINILYLTIILFGLVLLITYFIGIINIFLNSAPFVPTGKREIKAIIKVLKEHNIKTLVDLGCGDGYLITSIANTGIHVTGFETNPFLYLISHTRKLFSKNNNSIKLYNVSLLKADLHQYDSIFIYGVPKLLELIEKNIIKECKKGTLVISNKFEFKKITQINRIGKLYFYSV